MTDKKKEKRPVKYYLKKVFGGIILIGGLNNLFSQLFVVGEGVLWTQTPEAKAMSLLMGVVFIIMGLYLVTDGKWWHQK